RRAPIRSEPDRDRPLGDDVRQLVPLVDELVELQMEITEAGAGDVPVKLLADQRERDQLRERQLKQVACLLASMLAERWKMGLVLGNCHRWLLLLGFGHCTHTGPVC